MLFFGTSTTFCGLAILYGRLLNLGGALKGWLKRSVVAFLLLNCCWSGSAFPYFSSMCGSFIRLNDGMNFFTSFTHLFREKCSRRFFHISLHLNRCLFPEIIQIYNSFQSSSKQEFYKLIYQHLPAFTRNRISAHCAIEYSARAISYGDMWTFVLILLVILLYCSEITMHGFSFPGHEFYFSMISKLEFTKNYIPHSIFIYFLRVKLPLFGKLFIKLTNDDESHSCSGQSDVDLMFIDNESHVLLTPTNRRFLFDFISRHRTNQAQDNKIPFVPWPMKTNFNPVTNEKLFTYWSSSH